MRRAATEEFYFLLQLLSAFMACHDPTSWPRLARKELRDSSVDSAARWCDLVFSQFSCMDTHFGDQEAQYGCSSP